MFYFCYGFKYFLKKVVVYIIFLLSGGIVIDWKFIISLKRKRGFKLIISFGYTGKVPRALSILHNPGYVNSNLIATWVGCYTYISLKLPSKQHSKMTQLLKGYSNDLYKKNPIFCITLLVKGSHKSQLLSSTAACSCTAQV